MINNMNLTDKELKESYWLVTHAERMRRGVIRAVIIGEAIIVLAFLVQFSGYLYFAVVRNATIVQPLLAHAQQTFPLLTLEDPRVISSGALDHGTGSVDLYAVIQNPHPNWRATVPVIFSIHGVDQPAVTTVLFPGDTKYVLLPGVAVANTQGISAHVGEVLWKRLNQSEIATIAQRKTIAVSDISIESGRSASGVVIPGTRLRFILENKTVYNLTDFRVTVVAKHGSSPIAALTLPIFSLARNQRIPLEARWEYQFAATDYDVIPDIDLLDENHVRPAL